MNKKELGVYIHIPFCKQKCYYCDFVSYAQNNDSIFPYIESLKKEIQEFNFEGYQVSTIYLGGGTPSYLESNFIQEILEELKKKIDFKNIEITIEINPGTVTKEKLKTYKKIGINRISIGLQSTNDSLLKQIGRIHNYEEFLNTYKWAREVGFDNINVDLMLGLPNQTIEDLKESLNKVTKLNPKPEHISVYSLIVEEGTKIEKQIAEGKLELPEEEQERRMYWYMKNYLELQGYKHYEISNFAKENKESKHNLNCWNQEEYIGFGLAAHSYINLVRYCNTSNLEKYIKNRKQNVQIQEKQTIEDKQKEYMMLGFRKIEGVDITKFKEKFIQNPIYLYHNSLAKLVEEGLIEIDLDHIRLTNKGLDLANIVFEEFV